MSEAVARLLAVALVRDAGASDATVGLGSWWRMASTGLGGGSSGRIV